MSRHNPAHPSFTGLNPLAIEKVVRLALEIVSDLAKDEDWAAIEKWEHAQLEIEERLALWSCLDSQQRSALKSLGDSKTYKE